MLRRERRDTVRRSPMARTASKPSGSSRLTETPLVHERLLTPKCAGAAPELARAAPEFAGAVPELAGVVPGLAGAVPELVGPAPGLLSAEFSRN